MTKLNGREAVVTALRREGVRYVFGIPGGHSVEIMYNALHGISDIQQILTRHEQSAAFMGCCYAQATNEPGVVQGTAGPGVGNLVAGINEALSGKWPLIAICPGSPRLGFGKGVQQEIDQISYIRPNTKWSFRVEIPEKIPWALKRAFDISCAPPCGPVFVEIPIDLGSAEADIPEYIRSYRPLLSAGDEEKVRVAGDLLLKAQSPIIWAGGGVHRSRAWSELRELAETLAIPVLTTISGKGALPEDHPLCVGGVGICRNSISQKMLESADLVIGIGSQYEETATAGWEWWPKVAKFVQIDVDPCQISRNLVPDVAIVGDAKIVLRQLLSLIKEKASRRMQEYPRFTSLVGTKKEFLEAVSDVQSSGKPVRMQKMMKEIQRAISRESWIVVDVGVNQIWASTWPYLQVLKEGHFISASEYLCMGFGVAGVIAVKLAHPKEQAICITGDGGFQMAGKELITAVQYKTPVVWFISNNSALGWIKWFTKEFHSGKYVGVDFDEQPDFVRWAESHHCVGIHVEKAEELREAVKAALKSNEEGVPAVVDVVTDPLDVPEGFSSWHHKVVNR